MNQHLTCAVILGTLLAIACGVPSCDAQGQSDATQQDNRQEAAASVNEFEEGLPPTVEESRSTR